MGTWFDDPEIYEWFSANLHRVREPSQRHYARARLVAELLKSAAYASTAARVQAFVEQGGGCRATFFNHRRRLNGGNRAGGAPSP